MVNIDGTLFDENDINSLFNENRGYKYGDAVFETLKVINNNILFWEDHYFRLMASMRMLRMEIPMNFTMENLELEVLKTIEANNLKNQPVRVRINVDRGFGGKYLPKNFNSISFNIIVEKTKTELYNIHHISYTVDLFKDYYMAPGLLSGLKTNNKLLQVIGSIYAKENDLKNCLVLNTNKNVVEALNGNLFLIKGNYIKTPPLEDGCLRGVMRKQILKLLVKDVNLIVEETSISPFELQKADELFVTNVIQGIQPITKYRKKTYSTEFSENLLRQLNALIKLNAS